MTKQRLAFSVRIFRAHGNERKYLSSFYTFSPWKAINFLLNFTFLGVLGR